MEDRPHANKSAVVIGAGISGLCAAYWLKKQGITVTVLERDASVGGTMKTYHDGGWLVETGPNSALETTPLFGKLIDELGITGDREYANEAADKRYILRDGLLHTLPTKPGAFLASSLWTAGGKLRLLKEPFVGRASKEESIAEFVTRRLGREFLEYAINPFVAGVYAGNPEQLSVRSAFPKLYALEEKYGGLIIGMIRSRRERNARNEVAKDRAKMFSFKNGMQTLPNAIAAALGDAVRLNCSVERIVPMRAGKFPVYTVFWKENNEPRTLEANAVILATPAHAAAAIVQSIDPEMSKTLSSIYYPPVAEVFLGFRQEQVKRPLDGFGFLIPEKEKRNILGTIWSSSLFPDRAPAGHVATTSFLGGARQPDLASKNEAEIQEIVLRELRSLIGAEGNPAYAKIIRWEKAIPQYNVGYYKTLQAIERFEQNFQGAFICSNYRGGISVGDCLMSAEKMSTIVSSYLGS
ncbi:MAG TPA: protoporphyrinogen oxidase [Bacteroidota bacterium]|nr:protoporphyrinogen oxidase [Bacteroidota bacterium]